MAGRLLGQLLVMGGAVVGRAVVQAYRQAIVRECPLSLSPSAKIFVPYFPFLAPDSANEAVLFTPSLLT
ncbi:hypothetical protein TRIUR3_29499 [Triticum urartu]|uniref:Uncharacterized protein n=1 Tax=Triticum urartu TaxID=4572 RepID=M7ZLN9_TRIUA|nr:hypothetical protein TRIUR3_29499 [Triticum urartu]